MNTLRQTAAATILSLALAVSAFAGQISSPGAVQPPPTKPATATLTDDTTITDYSMSTDYSTTLILTIFNLIPIL